MESTIVALIKNKDSFALNDRLNVKKSLTEDVLKNLQFLENDFMYTTDTTRKD